MFIHPQIKLMQVSSVHKKEKLPRKPKNDFDNDIAIFVLFNAVASQKMTLTKSFQHQRVDLL